MLKRTLLILSFALITIPVIQAIAANCPTLPELPKATEQEADFQAAWQWVSEPYSIYEYAGSRDKSPLGIGHLKIAYIDDGSYDWPRKIVLPIWDHPDGSLLAWIRSGLVHPADGTASFPLSGAGLVETDYEQLTFVVTEEAGDWLKLRFKAGEGGVGWVHRCHLQLGKISLSYQSWQELLTEKGDWLHFRTDVVHSLRAEPSAESQRVTTIGLDHKLEMLKIEGDWMQVEVTQPDLTCTGSDQPFEGTTHKGWTRWRDDLAGPWVWYYTRGC